MTENKLIKITSLERIAIFLFFLETFNSFDDDFQHKYGSKELTEQKLTRELLEQSLKFGSLPVNFYRPIDYFKNDEKSMEKLIILMHLLNVDYNDFPYMEEYKKKFIENIRILCIDDFFFR